MARLWKEEAIRAKTTLRYHRNHVYKVVWGRLPRQRFTHAARTDQSLALTIYFESLDIQCR